MSKGLETFIDKINKLQGEMLSIEEVSKILSMPKSFLYHLQCSDKAIPSIKIGNRIRFFKIDIIEWVKSCANQKKGDLYERR